MTTKTWRVEIVGGVQDGLVFAVATDANDIIVFGCGTNNRGVGRNINDVYSSDKYKISDVTGYDLMIALKNVRGYINPMDIDQSIVMHDAY